MNEWLIQQGIVNPQTGLVVGLLVGLLAAILLAWLVSRRGARALAESEQGSAVLQTRLADKELHYQEQISKLEDAEKRLSENFERLAGKIFEARSEKLSDLNTKQMDAILKPLSEKILEFRNTVERAHKEETAQHRVMKEKIGDLEKLNERLHEDATNLSRALTSNVKAQGSWGEQQLERLLEVAGLQKGVEYSTQYSVTTESGQRWTRFQACEGDEAGQAEAMKEHIQSIRQHIKNLGEKRYAEVPELNALDFVLMFVPIESALIAALQADPELPEFALRNKVALLSPTNFLATMRTVASVWSVHKQNTNAQDIARRAGLLYDKFAGFVENLQGVGDRLSQAQQSYEKAFGQLSRGAGNLLRQTEQLRELGARSTRQLDAALVEQSDDETPALTVVKNDDSTDNQHKD